MNKEQQKIDFIGAFLLMISISSVMYILVEGGMAFAWNSVYAIGLVVLSISSFIWLFIHEKKSQTSILPPQIWKHRLILIANVTSLVTGVIMISVSSYLPTFVQGVMGKSALVAGFTLTTMSIGWPIASTLAGRLLLRIGYRYTSLIGGVSLVVGTLIFVLLPVIQHHVWAGIGSFFIGIGMGMTSTAFIVAIQTKVNWEIRGIATATNMFMRSIGSALGVAFFGGMLNNTIQRYIEKANLDENITVDAIDKLLDTTLISTMSKDVIHVLQKGLIQGMQQIYIGLVVLALISLILIWWIPKQDKK